MYLFGMGSRHGNISFFANIMAKAIHRKAANSQRSTYLNRLVVDNNVIVYYSYPFLATSRCYFVSNLFSIIRGFYCPKFYESVVKEEHFSAIISNL